jgi:diadenosine tetraphosphate (Ap4A) HIT family hydrolase
VATNICSYCSISSEDAWISNSLASAVPHPHPIARFHILIVPSRHVSAFYDLDVQEQHAIWEIIGEIQKKLAGEMELLGVDIGFEDGKSEQAHAHVHVVPRTAGQTVQLPHDVEWVYSETGAV